MPHLHLDEHGNRDMSPSVSPNLPGLRLAAVRDPRSVVTDLSAGFVLPPGAMNERDVGPIGEIPRVGGSIDDNVRATDVVIVDEGAERASELPSGVAGARECFRRTGAAAEPFSKRSMEKSRRWRIPFES